MSLPRTLGELRHSPFSEAQLRSRRVKDELRDNLMAKLRQGGPIFSGIVGYDDTVVPQIINAILSRHNFILAGTSRPGQEPDLTRPHHIAGCADALHRRL